MNFGAYREIWRHPAVRQAAVLGALGKAPWFGAGYILTIHVVGRLHQSYSAAGLLTALFTVAAAFASPWRGRLLDTKGLRRTLAPSLIVLPVLFALAPLATYWPLLIAMAVVGLLAVPWFVLTRQLMLAAVPVDQHRTVLALDSVITEAAFIVGPTLGVAAAVSWDSGLALATFALLSMGAAGVLWWKNPPLTSENAPDGEPVRGLSWVNGSVAALYVTTVAITFTLGGTDIAMVAAVRSMNATPLLAVAITLWGFGSLVGGFLYGTVSRHVPVLWLAIALGMTTIPVALASDPWVLSALLFFTGLFCAPSMAATVEGISQAVAENRRGEAMGWQGTFSTLGNAAAPPLIGLIMDLHGWEQGFVWTGVLGLLMALTGAALMRLGRHWVRRRRQPC